jgi:uncharacterized protein with HEPN domain
VSPEKNLRAWPQRVRDMIDAAREIRSFVAGMTFEQFAADARTQKAVLADFNIIGEAAAHVPESVKEANPIVAWRQARSTRNIIVHVYFAVDQRTVWDTIQNDLPKMEQELAQVLEKEAK